MNRTGFLKDLLFLTILIPVSLFSQPDAKRFSFSPQMAISNIPCALHIQALREDGKADTAFSGSVRVEGLFQRGISGNVAISQTGPFVLGRLLLKDIVFPSAGKQQFNLVHETRTPLSIHVIPGILSLFPPIMAIVLALVFRQVLISLFMGIWLGSTLMWGYNPFVGLLRLLDRTIVNSLASTDHAAIILFSMMLGGMVGIISRSGGTQGIVEKLTRLSGSPRGGQIATWALGVFIFFDDYANTLIVGNTMRPITDRLRISREKLSFIVDATAAPVCCIGVISTWIGFELGLIQETFQFLGIERNIYLTYLQTIPYRFYCILTVLFVFFVAVTLRDFGPMWHAERRSKLTGKVIRDGAIPMTNPNLSEITPPDGTPLRWINAVLPIFMVILATLVGLYFNGRENLLAGNIASPSFKDIIGAAESFEVLMWSSFAGVFVAGFLAMTQRILSLRETLDAWVSGIKAMFFAMIILVFAWAMGDICAELRTADYVIQITRGFLSPHFIPLVTFIIASLISFATGTSWGTMSILVPIVIPLAHHFSLEYISDPRMAEAILIGTLGSVLSGSVFGDHCSPISDTTIMSSMASGSDHVDHVRTQLPYAITVAVVSMLLGYLPIGFGFNPFYSLLLGSALLMAILLIIGKKIV